MKNNYYFSHDYNARNDPKLQGLIMDYGMAGIGVFWCIVENLYEQGGKLPIANIKSIAFSMHVERKMLESIIFDSELFQHDDDFFWSNSVLERLKGRKELSEKNRLNVQKRWEKHRETMRQDNEPNTSVSENDTTVLPQEYDRNTIKEKESKVNKISTNVDNKEKKKEKVSTIVDTQKKDKEKSAADAALNKHKEQFIESLRPFLDLYGREMINDFFGYWSEPNKSHTKMRFELERTWDVSLRLATWARNQHKYNKSNSYGKSTNDSKKESARNLVALSERLLQGLAD